MNLKLWTFIAVVALLAFVNGTPSNKRALDRVLPPPRTIIGDCTTDEDCPDQFICVSVCNKTDKKRCFLAECSSCLSGWTQFNDKCYLIQDQFAGDIYFAKSFCEDRDAILAEPRTPDENEFIKGQIAALTTTSGYYWFGLKDDGNGYVWYSDETAPTYTDWGFIEWGYGCASYAYTDSIVWTKDDCTFSGQYPVCQQSIICTVISPRKSNHP